MFVFLIVNWNFPSPESDFVLWCLVPVYLQSNLPLKLMWIFSGIKKRIQKRRQAKLKKKQQKEEAEEKVPSIEPDESAMNNNN